MFLPATGKAGNLHKISGKLLFFYWIYIGTFSFGGGTVVQFMIQNTFIYKLKLLTETDYSEIIGIGQITPGINILAYTILIGYRLAGWKGSLLSVLGLILPSALITILLSSIYLLFYDFPIVQHGIRTAFASIFGISCITNYRNVKPILEKGTPGRYFSIFSSIEHSCSNLLFLSNFSNRHHLAIWIRRSYWWICLYSYREKPEEIFMNWFFFFSTILKAVLFSTGGFGPLPLLHADFISRAWAY